MYVQRFQRHVLKDTRHILTSAQNTRDWACDSFTKCNNIFLFARNDKKLVQPKCFSFTQLQIIILLGLREQGIVVNHSLPYA